MELSIAIRVLQLDTNLFIGICDVSGMRIRGGTRDNALDAAQSCLASLAGTSGNSDDARIAISLGLRQIDLDQAVNDAVKKIESPKGRNKS